jgi:hypothetical protein
MNRASAALAHATTEFRASEPERIAQYPEQRRVGFNVDGLFLFVNG